MDRIQIQASKLWDLLFADETAETYQTTLNLTGTLIKETAQLIWLIICSVFVFGAWFSDTSVKTGKGIRTWVDQQGSETSAPDDQPSMADTSKNLLDTGRTGIAYLLNQAREQLGIEAEETPKVIQSSPSKPASTPVVSASATSTTAQSPTLRPVSQGAGSQSTAAETSREASDDGWPPQQDD
jgi:hypothetical protein